jgi:hypothetical protein
MYDVAIWQALEDIREIAKGLIGRGAPIKRLCQNQSVRDFKGGPSVPGAVQCSEASAPLPSRVTLHLTLLFFTPCPHHIRLYIPLPFYMSARCRQNGPQCVWTDTNDAKLVQKLQECKDLGMQLDSSWKPAVWSACAAVLKDSQGAEKTGDKCQDHYTNVRDHPASHHVASHHSFISLAQRSF